MLHNQASKTPPDTGCIFCKSTQHLTESCRTDLSLSEKKKLLAADMRCFRCTIKGHRARDCRRRIACSGCRGRHASSICDPDKLNRKAHEDVKGSSTTVCAATTKSNERSDTLTCVLLQTFRAWAVTDYSCRYIRGVFDGGSERTFVTEALSRRLKLRCLGFDTIAINTFASVSSCTPKRFRIVELHLRSQHSDVEVALRAIEIPHICRDISVNTMTHSFVTSLKKNRARYRR